MQGWSHGDSYTLPVRPSPNLADARAIELYPSLCLFEATIMSLGRGTDAPFRMLGYPHEQFGTHTFVPEVRVGADSNPRYRGQVCYGVDLTTASLPARQLSLRWLLHYQRVAEAQGLELIDRARMFELLAGNKRLASQIRQGLSEQEIRASWEADLARYRTLRSKYLLYPDYPSSHH